MTNNTLTTIDGITVGHAQNNEGATGCTVVLCPPNTIGGVDQRGGAPGTRETDLLHPSHLVEHIHAILLTGGSAYGLDAAGGVMRFLEEKSIGFNIGVGVVPIVPAAVIFDLGIGDSRVRPDAAMGYSACQNATPMAVKEGCVGAGTGATVGKMIGMTYACKSGIGSFAIELSEGVKVAALFVVNAIGDVLDAEGKILAGARNPQNSITFIDSMNVIKNMALMDATPPSPSNTVIGIVATNARLNKEEVNKMAQMAHDGLARAVRPAHTMFDGDTIFALATATAGHTNVSAIGAFAAEVSAEAIRRAVRAASGLAGIPSISDLKPPTDTL